MSLYNDNRETIICLSSAGFMPSNVHDEPLICPYRGPDAESLLNKTHDEITRLIDEVNSQRGDIVVRRFWTIDTCCIVDDRSCDVNQPSYFSRNSSTIIKSAEAKKKRKHLSLRT